MFDPEELSSIEAIPLTEEDIQLDEEILKVLFDNAGKMNTLVDSAAYAVMMESETMFASSLTSLLLFGFNLGIKFQKEQEND